MPMPMGDLFAPDINFTPIRGVYPTAGGGTLASAGGAMSQNTNTTYPDAIAGTMVPTTLAGTQATGDNSGGKSLGYWIGFVALLLFTVWVARKAGGPEDFRNIRPTLYNFLAITLTAIVGIVGLKVIFAKYHVPGASELVLAV